MVEIRKAEKEDHINMAHILVPAFSDKAEAIMGDASKAVAIIPIIVDALKGLKLLASDNIRPVGAIIVSTEELELPPETFTVLRKEVGFLGALRAVRIVNNYEKSLPSGSGGGNGRGPKQRHWHAADQQCRDMGCRAGHGSLRPQREDRQSRCAAL
jgi:hypothetical protein